MSEKIIVMLLIAITGAGLTALRRWNNPGRNAGIALSGWTIALLGMILSRVSRYSGEDIPARRL